MIVDSHTHLLPGRLAEAVRAFFDNRAEALHTPMTYPLDHAEILRMVRAEGVDRVWSFPYAHKPGVAVGMNEASAATALAFRNGPVTVANGATVHPGDDAPGSIVVDAVDRLGASVLKLHCSVGSFTLDDLRLDPVFSACAERQLPIVVHLGQAVSGYTEADELASIARATERHPLTRFILAHCGHHAGPDAITLMGQRPNLYADLTPVGRNRPEIEPELVTTFADRLLFGSDTPNTPLSAAAGLEYVRSLGLAPDVESKVLGGNALRLESEVLRNG